MELALTPEDEAFSIFEYIAPPAEFNLGSQHQTADDAELSSFLGNTGSEKSDDSIPDKEPAQIAKLVTKKPARMLLWQFVLLQLLRGHSSLAWVSDQWSRPGVFKFNDTNDAARQWGNLKRNRNMSYEKMSRCIRDYYTRRANRYFGVMLPDARGKDHRRVHFAFNLQNADVLKYIKCHRPDYYWSLVEKEIVKHH